MRERIASPDTVGFLEGYAIRLFPYRFSLLVVSFITLLVLATGLLASVQLGVDPIPYLPILALSLPGMMWPIALLLFASWFHPDRGTLAILRPWFDTLSPRIQRALRIYGIAASGAFLLAPNFVLAVI